MATLCSSIDTEVLLTRAHSDQSYRQIFPSGSRKRCRGADSTLLSQPSSGQHEGCNTSSLQRSLSAGFGWDSMSQTVPLQSMERTLSCDVSALRAAAAAAVAEFTGSLEPSLQLTAPDKAHDLERAASKDPAGRPVAVRLGERANAGTNDLDGLSSLAPGKTDSSDFHGIHSSFDGVYTQRGCPPHGAKAICGRRPRMEDAYTAVPFLLEVPVPASNQAQPELLPPRIAPQVRSASNSLNSSDAEGRQDASDMADAVSSERKQSHNQTSTSGDHSAPEEGSYLETLHFFGVFDGHGGAEAALHCAQTLHLRISEALAAATELPSSGELAAVEREGDAIRPSESVPVGIPRLAADSAEGDSLDSTREQLEEHFYQEQGADVLTCNTASFESALTSAFNRTDEEFGKADNAALVGTTAVVTLVGSRQLYVANCGDSRAVLCRAGVAIPLTDDHKAAREDETARVEAAGGQILFWNGVRVMGVLAVSRAIGDHCLRPYVIAQPEVTIVGRRPDDELLLLASDGLWDVLTNKEACTLAKRCLRRARQRGASRQSAARIAATVLTRAAVDRGSRDNVTVLVVDLSSGSNDQETARTQSALFAESATDRAQETDAEEKRGEKRGVKAQEVQAATLGAESSGIEDGGH